MKKTKRLYKSEPAHIWAYLRTLGVSKQALKNVKAELLYWAMEKGTDIKTARIMTVIADVLWDMGWRKKRVTAFLHDFTDRSQHTWDEEGKPWARYYREVAEKTGWIFQELDDDMVQMCEVDFSEEEWDIDTGSGKGGDT